MGEVLILLPQLPCRRGGRWPAGERAATERPTGEGEQVGMGVLGWAGFGQLGRG